MRPGCHVLADEIYLDAVAGPPQAVAASVSPRIITSSSLTKVYGLCYLAATDRRGARTALRASCPDELVVSSRLPTRL